jgi:hypothetical protein
MCFHLRGNLLTKIHATDPNAMPICNTIDNEGVSFLLSIGLSGFDIVAVRFQLVVRYKNCGKSLHERVAKA